MGGAIYTGRDNLYLDESREGAWLARGGAAHVHWWRLDDGSYRIGWDVGRFLWLGFEGAPTERGLEGAFRFSSHSGEALVSDPDDSRFQAEAVLEPHACNRAELRALMEASASGS